MKKVELIGVLLLLIGMAGCTENEMLTYENDPAVYFAGAGENKADSLNHSFFLLDVNVLSDTVWVRVNTMGELSSQHRPVVLVQTNAGAEDAAVAGVHYVPFDDAGLKPLQYVPAGKEFGDIPVVLLRDESLGTGKVRLELTVAGNDHFRPGMSDKLKFTITTTDLVEKPPYWDTMLRSVFGASWGPVKMRCLISTTGYTNWSINPQLLMSTVFLPLSVQVKQKLIEYNRDHPNDPLREDNGNLVTFDS
jgi:hypothetical protein